MNILLLGFVAQLVLFYGMILFSDYLKDVESLKSHGKRQAVKVKRPSIKS